MNCIKDRDDLRLRVEQVIQAKFDGFLDILGDFQRRLLTAGVCTSEDLSWWFASGHKVNLQAKGQFLPEYMLYKTLLYCINTDGDLINPRRTDDILVDEFYGENFGWFISLSLDKGTVTSTISGLGKTISELWDESQSEPLLQHSSRSALKRLIGSYRESDPSTIEYLLISTIILQGSGHLPFSPFLDIDSMSDRNISRVYETLKPYAGIFSGAIDAKISCHWSSHQLQFSVSPKLPLGYSPKKSTSIGLSSD